MDTLMDKLAQKLNAQEMIRANGAAESEQMQVLKTQVKEYQVCLDKMQQVCTELAQVQGQLSAIEMKDNGQNAEVLAELKSQIEEVARRSEEQLEEMNRRSSEQIAELTKKHEEQLEEMARKHAEQLNAMSKDLTDNLGTEEDFHTEGVRIYKNVQNVVEGSTSRLTDNMYATTAPVLKRVRGVRAVAIVGVAIGSFAVLLELFQLVVQIFHLNLF